MILGLTGLKWPASRCLMVPAEAVEAGDSRQSLVVEVVVEKMRMDQGDGGSVG